MPGLTLTSENPVYVEGDFNASAGAHGFVEPNAPAAIMADGITVLSNVWNDQSSFDTPNGATFRNAVTTWYRFAAVSGKGAPFPHPSGTFANFGTDGGHAQLRADDRGLVLRPDGQLPGPDDHLLRQPAGGRSVEVNVAKRGYSVGVDYNKVVYDAVSGETNYATTWTTGGTGTHGGDAGFILQGLSEYLDRFILAYLRVNEDACDQTR